MEEKGKLELQGARRVIYILLLLISAPVVSGAVIYFTRFTVTGLIRNVIIMIIMSGVLLVVINAMLKSKNLSYDNISHPGRFVTAYTAGILLSGAAALLPELVVPLASVCVIIALLSDYLVGTVSCMIISALPLFITGGSFEYYIFYFLTGILIISLMMCGNDEFRVKEPLLVFSLLYIVSYTALIILKRLDITPAVIINPAVGLCLDVLVMAIAFRMISSSIIFKYRDRYKETVDPEYHLLMDLKGRNHFEYKRAIHTSYLCERISAITGTDCIDMKGAGFYHRIGILACEDGNTDNIPEKSLEMIRNEQFPPGIINIIVEYGEKRTGVISKEVSVLMIADSVIYDILDEFEIKKAQTIDSDGIIDNVYLTLEKKGIIKNSALSLYELNKIRKYLKEEKLYYDFLR